MSGSGYQVPNWAGKPPTGLHLDVLKEGKLVQKLMIDQKKCYLFGRNSQLNDFCIDHASCSRVHSAFVYHKHLGRAFLVDLGSTHGTFIGSVRLEAQKPTPLNVDSRFHFGASTRNYILRERPQTGSRPIMDELENSVTEDGKPVDSSLLGLPETETELDNLTEFNTAHNRRITMMGIPNEDDKRKGKHRIVKITFNEDEDIINPEDVDPSIGRYRNMVVTTVIPKKRPNASSAPGLLATSDSHATGAGHKSAMHPHFRSPVKRPAVAHPAGRVGLYDNLEGPSASKLMGLSLPLPNPAPDIDIAPSHSHDDMLPMSAQHYETANAAAQQSLEVEGDLPKRKKYAKEAWPGRKHSNPLLG